MNGHFANDDRPLQRRAPDAPEENPTDPPLPLARTRLTVTGQAVQVTPNDPTSRHPSWGATRFQVMCDSEEEPYDRTVKVATEWQLIDFGWTEEEGSTGCGFVLIYNPGRQATGFRQSAQEMEELSSRMLEVGLRGGDGHIKEFSFIPPGADIRLFPLATDHFYIRCTGGPHKYKIFAVPA